mgnify:FL=1
MKKLAIKLAIIFFWVFMMFTLVRERIFRRAPNHRDLQTAAFDAASDWRDQEEWMRIFYKGLSVGAMNVSLARDGEAGYVFLARLLMEFKLLTFKNSIMMTIGAELDGSFILRRFAAKMRGEGKKWDIDGAYRDGRLFYRVAGEDGATAGDFEMKRPPSLLEAARANLGRNLELKAGKVYRIPVYDPIWGGGGGEAVVRVARRENIALGSEPVSAWRVETTLNNSTTIAWLDNSGATLMRQLMPDLVMRRAGRQEILALNQEFAAPIPRPSFAVEDLMQKHSGGAHSEPIPSMLHDFLKGEH